MIYCDNCTRILDQDMQICPFCDEKDTNWRDPQKPEVYKPSTSYVNSEVFERLREINRHIEEKTESQNFESAEAFKPEDKPSKSEYIFMIILAASFSLVGFIIGIVYITKKNKNYQSLGALTLLISMLSSVFWIVVTFGLFFMIVPF